MADKKDFETATTKEETAERVAVYVPRGRPGEDPNLLISVNGVNHVLPKGETSMVLPEIAEEYYRSVKATDAFYDMMDQREKESLRGTNEVLGL